MKVKIDKYNGYLFAPVTVHYDAMWHLVLRVEVPPYTDENPVFAQEYCENVTHEIVEWKENRPGDAAFVIEPILSTIQVLVHTTLDKEKLNELTKALQDAVNHIDEKGYYGN